MRRFVLSLALCYFVLVFFYPLSITITSLEEERANLCAFRTFVRFALVFFLSVSSSFWCLGRAATCDCGTPWTFLLPFYTLFFLFLIKNIDCGYLLEPPRRGGSNECPQSIFWAEIWKISEFLSENLHFFLVAKFWVYLNRLVFIMKLLCVAWLVSGLSPMVKRT